MAMPRLIAMIHSRTVVRVGMTQSLECWIEWQQPGHDARFRVRIAECPALRRSIPSKCVICLFTGWHPVRREQGYIVSWMPFHLVWAYGKVCRPLGWMPSNKSLQPSFVAVALGLAQQRPSQLVSSGT